MLIGLIKVKATCVLSASTVEQPVRLIARHAGAGTPSRLFLLNFALALRYGEDTSIFTAALDAFVAVLIHSSEIFPQILVSGRDGVTLAY